MASIPILQSPPPKSPSYDNQIISIFRQHHDGVDRQSAMRSSNLQRITTAVNQSHRNQIQFHFINTNYTDRRFDFNNYSISTMSDSFNAKNETKSGDGVKDTKEREKSREIPPPPEKPLPGDCCGSGCVRCVWDVYYEELEEYNKLIKGDTGSKV